MKTRQAQQDMLSRCFSNEFDRISLVEKFNRPPGLVADITNATEATRMVVNHDWKVAAGTNSTSALCTLSTGGGVTLTTAGADADQEIITPQAAAGMSAWGTIDWSTDDEVAFRTRIKTGASIADVKLWSGCILSLASPFVLGTDADQILWYYNPSVNSGKWQGVYSVAGTDYTIDSGITVAASTTYDLALYIDEDRYPHFFINGDEVFADVEAMTTGIDLVPYIGAQADTAAAKACTCRGVAMSKTQND